jgi:hypothetical protein
LGSFENNFATYPNLQLQNLTHGDIDLYVRNRFHRNDAFRKLAAKEPKSSLSLKQEVVEKTEGVFLWVRIVVDSLLRGIRNLDDMPVLLGRLNMLPRELELQIEPVYLVWASKAFQIVQASGDADNHPLASRLYVLPLTVSSIYFAIDEDIVSNNIRTLTLQVIEQRNQTTQVHLTALCAGLLEVSTPMKEGKKYIGLYSTVPAQICSRFS